MTLLRLLVNIKNNSEQSLSIKTEILVTFQVGDGSESEL
jgi:hypothetical protein